MSDAYISTDNLADPYQQDIHTGMCEEQFRFQNHEVMARAECHHCGGSIPEGDEFSWKYAAAGGCLEGPFCSPACYWGWVV